MSGLVGHYGVELSLREGGFIHRQPLAEILFEEYILHSVTTVDRSADRPAPPCSGSPRGWAKSLAQGAQPRQTAGEKAAAGTVLTRFTQ